MWKRVADLATALGILTVGRGGTGAATFTDGGVLIGNGTNAVQVTTAGTAGQVLTSNGAGVDPTFQAAAGGGFWEHIVISGAPRHDGSITWVAVSGLWVFSPADSGHKHGGILHVAAPANTDQVQKANIRVPTSGTYALRVLHTKHDASGIAKVRWDGVQKATIDAYQAGTDYYNHWSAEIGLGSLTAGTAYTLNFLADDKNGLSLGYAFEIGEVHIYRTA